MTIAGDAVVASGARAMQLAIILLIAVGILGVAFGMAWRNSVRDDRNDAGRK